ncbi:MAG: putative petrobactin biosynthesis protein AsbE [Paenibacillaceae bacterium]|jgi:hypothetical protein|nr:putative petrobactin biosynthesis protein AsbE [Paenibacillaceae bacterium]
MREWVHIHCLLDCLRHILVEADIQDVLPLYFGVWDTPFETTPEGLLTYSSANLDGDISTEAMEFLYGTPLTCWYNYRGSKRQNLEQLDRLASEGGQAVYLLPQLDLYELSYHQRCYRQIHRPHYVIAARGTGGGWKITDPSFGWEGEIAEAEFDAAFCSNSLGGGFLVHAGSLVNPKPEQAGAFFEEGWSRKTYRLSEAFLSLLERMGHHEPELMGRLSANVEQLGILASRKQSYLLAFSYFDPRADLQREQELVHNLLKGWRSAAYAAIRIAITKDRTALQRLAARVVALGEEEEGLKQELWHSYERWRLVFPI